MRIGPFADCCPRAASGHVSSRAAQCEYEFSPSDVDCHATPPAGGRVHAIEGRYHALTKERTMLLRCESLEPPMSQLGQSRRFGDVCDMSALPPTTAVMMQCRERQKGANSELMHCSKKPLHSITSSASASSLSGISRPSAFAVLRLITKSNFVDCWTGKSAGFSPLRMRPA